jgi:hypothetical protein
MQLRRIGEAITACSEPITACSEPITAVSSGHGNYKETGVSARGGDPFYHWQLETSANKLK